MEEGGLASGGDHKRGISFRISPTGLLRKYF